MLEKPENGAVYYGDDRVDVLPESELLLRRRRIGMIFQNFNLFSSRHVQGNVAYPLEVAGCPKEQILPRVKELLQLVGLSDKITSPISKLSGGQKQRVAIARALANLPDVLFCDEATSALDPQTTLSILDLIRDIQSKMGLTVVMITHQMEVVREICDYVSVLDNGMIVESGTVKDIFSSPKTEVAREFLRALKPIEERELLSESPFMAARYRLNFVGESTHEPVLSRLVQIFGLEVNILSGTIHPLNPPVGELIVEISGSSENLDKALAWLEEHNVGLEVLN
jgi:D-methionine transport system ATP-binding protein